MEDKIHFTPKMILQKEFKQKMRGYDPNEVDVFLDNVIKDYGTFGRQIQQLQDENDRLRSRVDELNRQLQMSQANASTNDGRDDEYQSRHANNANVNATNIDILKRLSNLERRVFGSQMGSDGNDSHRF